LAIIEVDDLDDLLLGQLREDDGVVDAVEELGPEVLLQLVVDLGLHPLVVVFGCRPGGEAEATPLEMSRVPRLVVMMMTVFLKSTTDPASR
jgi:hypothetical protein